ncbi:hypothetical protein HispidOSU_022725, partial [Sigmodon hispidus]
LKSIFQDLSVTTLQSPHPNHYLCCTHVYDHMNSIPVLNSPCKEKYLMRKYVNQSIESLELQVSVRKSSIEIEEKYYNSAEPQRSSLFATSR